MILDANGQPLLPPAAAPNKMMVGTGIPGVQIGLPGNPLAPPGAAPAAIAPPPQQQAATPPPTAQRPSLPPPPPAASRSIPLEPLLQSGPGQGLTPSQFKIAGSMIAAGTPIAQVMSHVEQWRQANLSNRQQAATAAAVEAQQNYDRQRQYQQDTRQAQIDAQTAQQRTLENQRQAEADKRAAETQRLAQEGATRDTERLDIEKKKFEQGSAQPERDAYTLRTSDPTSQEYADAWARKKWTVAPNGNVIENDVSMYPAPSRSIQRPSFLPAPTPQGLDEVRKADTDAKVITSAIDHFVDVHAATGGQSWDAYFDNPKSTQAQQLLGAFDRMKTVLRSPQYFNTGVLQPAEMRMMEQDLISPQTLRGLYATPQALASRLGEIKLAILTRQDAELRSVGRPGVIVRDKADFAGVPEGGRYYDEDGHLHVKQTGK